MEAIVPREADIGGLIVRRSLPVRTRRSVGPWVFFDHMGPARFGTGRGLDVIPHPHINLATVTYLFDGEIIHRDSIGTVQTIAPGEINLMFAGRGIVHSERTDIARRTSPHTAHGLQLWMALPEDSEDMEPSFYHYSSDALPAVSVDGSQVRVMIGELFGKTSPVRVESPSLYAEAVFEPNSSLRLPNTYSEMAVYIVEGEVSVNGEAYPAPAFVICDRNVEHSLGAQTHSRIVVVGGEPLGKRYMWWNFVSSNLEKIESAIDSWKENRMGSVPGETERAELPESDSFSSIKA